MPLIKIQEGLLERDNFYLTSGFSDFLGNGTYTRKSGAFELKQGEIKRNFYFQDFVIEVRKEEAILNPNESHFFFVEVINRQTRVLQKIGLYEDQQAHATHWKIICHDQFIQTYVSQDGLNWNNIGGYKLIDEEVVYQGFEVKGETALTFTDYRVYHNPFVTLLNFDEGYKAELYNLNDDLIKTRLFEEDMMVTLFLDDNLEGYFKVYDLTGQLVYTSPSDSLEMGSIYSYTPYDLEITYKGDVIGYGPTHLKSNLQMLQLKNVGSEAYYNLRLIPFKATSKEDVIELSLDGVTYADKVIIETLEVQQVQDIYVRITKENEYDFEVHSFEIKIY